jgi:hypothetical protein
VLLLHHHLALDHSTLEILLGEMQAHRRGRLSWRRLFILPLSLAGPENNSCWLLKTFPKPGKIPKIDEGKEG